MVIRFRNPAAAIAGTPWAAWRGWPSSSFGYPAAANDSIIIPSRDEAAACRRGRRRKTSRSDARLPGLRHAPAGASWDTARSLQFRRFQRVLKAGAAITGANVTSSIGARMAIDGRTAEKLRGFLRELSPAGARNAARRARARRAGGEPLPGSDLIMRELRNVGRADPTGAAAAAAAPLRRRPPPRPPTRTTPGAPVLRLPRAVLRRRRARARPPGAHRARRGRADLGVDLPRSPAGRGGRLCGQGRAAARRRRAGQGARRVRVPGARRPGDREDACGRSRATTRRGASSPTRSERRARSTTCATLRPCSRRATCSRCSPASCRPRSATSPTSRSARSSTSSTRRRDSHREVYLDGAGAGDEPACRRRGN